MKNAKRPTKPRSKTAGPSPVPPNMRTVTPYLAIAGAAEALEFYKRAFGAKELSRNALPDGKLMHATMRIGDSVVMMADEFPGSEVRAPSNVGASTVMLHVYTKDVDKLWQRAVAAGARVAMPLDDMFWGERYGQLEDPFGHRWTLSMRIKMSPAEMERKRREAMGQFSQGEHPGRDSKT